MTRLYFDPITVECRDGQPRTFVWRRTIHQVSTIAKRWVVRVEWWRQEVIRQYYQVECEGCGLYEIYRERDSWFLERLYD